jgi:ectoine hydroxylase-related dioxygenase (phytanoyl-CoA dioxygenase family)
MSIHHIKLVHGSEPNRSNDRRIGFAIRYIPTYVRQTKVRDSAMLVRGTDKYHHFDPEPRPQADLDTEALAAHAEAVGRQVKALYQGTTSKSSAPEPRHLAADEETTMTPEQVLAIPPRVLTRRSASSISAKATSCSRPSSATSG